MYEFSRAGYSSAKKKVITEKGELVIENLSPDKKDDRMLKAAEAELYSVFSKYCSEPEKKG
ncbi:hypothetical protein [Ruminococcus flavefaciens]|uniref:hypothetical protein n=1 Tax=Ruminococcus flavefaciens TaxID=1265 RepID=UPI00048F05D7|nr:hypothetical protein [Ruminococcus flavefaciens]